VILLIPNKFYSSLLNEQESFPLSFESEEIALVKLFTREFVALQNSNCEYEHIPIKESVIICASREACKLEAEQAAQIKPRWTTAVYLVSC